MLDSNGKVEGLSDEEKHECQNHASLIFLSEELSIMNLFL